MSTDKINKLLAAYKKRRAARDKACSASYDAWDVLRAGILENYGSNAKINLKYDKLYINGVEYREES